MKKNQHAVLLLILVFSVVIRPIPSLGKPFHQANQPALPPPIAHEFFASLARAIDTASGRITLELRAGTFTATDGIQWRIPTGTTLVVTFQYRNGVLDVQTDPAALTFSQNVLFFPQGVIPNFYVKVSKITYDKNGRPVKIFQRNDSGFDDSYSPTETAAVLLPAAHHLEFPHEPADVFFGRPIAGFPYAVPPPWLPNPPPPAQTWIKRVRFAASGDQPALRVTLKDQATIWFTHPPANSTLLANFITVASPSFCQFQSIDFDLDDNRLKGTLASFVVTAQDGQFATNGVDLRLKQGCAFQLQTLDFDSRGGADASPVISGTDGFIKGGLSLGSRLSLSADANPARLASLISADGSQITLRSVSTMFTQAGAAFTAGPGSSLNIEVADGRLPLGPNYVLIRNGSITLDFTAAGGWRAGSAPLIKARIGLLACDVYAGRFGVRVGYETRLKGGTVRASDLTFDSTATPVLWGHFNSLAFDVEDGARLNVPDRFDAICDRGARLYADDPQSPLTIPANQNMIIGRVDAVVHFRKITIAHGPELRRGSFQASLLLKDDGKIEGTDVFMDGEAHLQSEVTKDDIVVEVEVEEGRLSYESDVPVIEAAIRFSVRPFGGVSIEGPSCPIMGIASKGPARTRYTVYPVNINLALDKAIKFPFMWLRIKGGRENEPRVWSFVPKPGETTAPEKVDALTASMTIDIPPRRDGQYGDDNRQQVVKSTCLVAGNSADITLPPKTYGDVPLNVSLSFPGGSPEFVAVPNPKIDLDIDLCNLDEVFAIVGAVVAVQLLAHLTPVLGAAVDILTGGPIGEGVAATLAMELLVKKLIASTIADMLSKQFSKGIKFRPLG